MRQPGPGTFAEFVKERFRGVLKLDELGAGDHQSSPRHFRPRQEIVGFMIQGPVKKGDIIEAARLFYDNYQLEAIEGREVQFLRSGRIRLRLYLKILNRHVSIIVLREE